MSPALNMRETAEAIGMARSTFRKQRHDLARTLGFPAPIREAKPYAWRPEAVAAWLSARAHALGGGGALPVNDDTPFRAHKAAEGRMQRARAVAHLRMVSAK